MFKTKARTVGPVGESPADFQATKRATSDLGNPSRMKIWADPGSVSFSCMSPLAAIRRRSERSRLVPPGCVIEALFGGRRRVRRLVAGVLAGQRLARDQLSRVSDPWVGCVICRVGRALTCDDATITGRNRVSGTSQVGALVTSPRLAVQGRVHPQPGHAPQAAGSQCATSRSPSPSTSTGSTTDAFTARSASSRQLSPRPTKWASITREHYLEAPVPAGAGSTQPRLHETRADLGSQSASRLLCASVGRYLL